MQPQKKQSMGASFKHAFEGIWQVIKEERNMKIHLIATALVVIVGYWVRLRRLEWCICLMLCGLVMALEILNAAIEAVVDMTMPGNHPLAKLAKDAAAGAVRVAAMTVVVAGCFNFLPKLAAPFAL